MTTIQFASSTTHAKCNKCTQDLYITVIQFIIECESVTGRNPVFTHAKLVFSYISLAAGLLNNVVDEVSRYFGKVISVWISGVKMQKKLKM